MPPTSCWQIRSSRIMLSRCGGSSGYRIMADISNELIYEVLKSVQAPLAQVDGKADGNKSDMLALRTQVTSIHHDLLSIYHELGGVHATLIRHEGRLDRIERRLELNAAPA